MLLIFAFLAVVAYHLLVEELTFHHDLLANALNELADARQQAIWLHQLRNQNKE